MQRLSESGVSPATTVRRGPLGPVKKPGAIPGLLLTAGLLAACGAEETAAGAPETIAGSAAPLEASRAIRDLITAVTPLAPTVSVSEKNAWFGRRKETLERLRAAGPEVGQEALRVYGERTDSLPEIRAGLLEVAAYAAPEASRELLVELVSAYGEHLHLRTKAAEFLARTSPDRAVEVIEPILAGDVPRRTYPPQERLLVAWSDACVRIDRDRFPFLCEVATDLKRTGDVRNAAVRMLGEEPHPQGRQALEGLLVESSGNSYVRRLAAQSLRATIRDAEFCPLLERILENEVDPSFQIFLDDMIRNNCP